MFKFGPKSLLVLLICVLCWTLSFAVSNDTGGQDEVRKKWFTIRKSVMEAVDSVAKMVLPTALSMSYEADISTECLASLLKWFNGVRNMKAWAWSMLDASGKVTPGFLSGSLTDLGDYDFCLSLDDESQYSAKTFTGQYCMAKLLLPLPPIPKKVSSNTQVINLNDVVGKDEVFSLVTNWLAALYRIPMRSGLCVPSTCSAEDVKKIGGLILASFPEVDLEVPHCETKALLEITQEQIIVLSFLGVLLLLTSICTLVDVLTKRRNPIPQFRKHFLHFSLRENAAKFFDHEVKHSKGHLQVIDGIRWWSMAWICLVHTYGLIQLSALGKLRNYLDFLNDILFGFISSAWLSVDVFFLIGGILVAYTTLRQLQRENGRMSFLKNVFRRIWRLTPALLTVIGFVFLLPLLGSGPLWNETVDKQIQLCKNNWWLAALYANSWLGHASACLVSTWYVSADLHLYIISPIFIYAFYKSKLVGIAVCLAAIITSCIAVFVLSMQYELYPYVMMMTFNEASTEEVFTTVYFRPYAHVGPYMVGILLGCFMQSYPKISPRWYTLIGGWCLSITLAMCVLIGPYRWVLGVFPSDVISALFQSLHKTVFALAVGWVIWASYYGYAGVVSTLLSWPGYKKLSQLVYLIYLLQLPVLWIRVGTFRKTMSSSHYNFFIEFLGIFVISSMLALIVHLLVESPFMSLDLAMFPKRHKKPSPVHDSPENGKLSFEKRGNKYDGETPVECLNINPLTLNEKL